MGAGRRALAGVGRLLPAAAALGALVIVPAARAEGGEAWRYAPASPPPQPPGAAPAPYPAPLGTVGQISFWAPNRGLLITGGPEGESPKTVPAGLYAYDGVEWHQLATVCGGRQGRIAWAGPDEFWTISDQRPGQVLSMSEGGLESVSLCHFLDGQVVGSYAMPLGQPDSYLRMDAAACLSPSDCWFAGEDGSAPNVGSFHLHWDGQKVSAVYDPEDHAVTGMASFHGRIYEGLAIGPQDAYLPRENRRHPAVIRTIAPAGQAPLCEGAPNQFCNAFTFSVSTSQELPVYPLGVVPDALGGFDVVGDGSPLGEGSTQLWAGASPLENSTEHASITILRKAEGSWTQVLPNPQAPESSPFPEHTELSGSNADQQTSQESLVGGAIAPEPGTDRAWLSLQNRFGPPRGAMVVLLQADGTLLETQELPGPLDPVGPRGPAGPIACAAPHDCWMATRNEGWLFHLGGQHERDTDPNFAGVITYRPPDSGVPTVYPDVPPVDDSLANQQPPPAPSGPAQQAPAPPSRPRKGRPLVTHIKSRFVHHRVLVISFTLTARAHVRLVGRRRDRVVAKTRNRSLRPGRHVLSLALDPARWPTKLQFEASPAEAPPVGEESSGSAGANDTISTG